MTKPIKPEGLSPLVGTWKTTGATSATSDAPGEPIEATDRYEWMEGGFFLLHHIDSQFPEVFHGLEVIGHDAASGDCSVTYFDSKGRTLTSTGELKGGVWRIFSATERFAGAFSEDGETLSGMWERSEDGLTWQPWIDLTLRKVRE